jgi:hypothetical protein
LGDAGTPAELEHRAFEVEKKARKQNTEAINSPIITTTGRLRCFSSATIANSGNVLMASPASQYVNIRVLAASTGTSYKISLHASELT